MKKNLLFFITMICTLAIQAQDTKKVFGSPTLVWYGIDFKLAKMAGFQGESPHTIRDEYFRAWNDVTIDMDLAKVFQKTTVAKDPNGITKRNLARETETITAPEGVDLTKEAIAEEVKALSVGYKKEGVGVVFIVESFDKTASIATVHVVFFDIATREILWHKEMTGKASGGSMKNGYVAAMKDIFSQIQKKEFSAWKKEANY